jgi:hypothetical protein
MEIIQTEWGPMERWRAAAMCIGQISNIVARADSAKAARRADAAEDDRPQLDTAPPPEDKAPALADATALPQPSVDAQHLASIDAAVDALTARMDRFEAAQAAQRKLEELEDAIEATLPPENSDGVTLN